VGVLEACSTESYAFDEEDMNILGRLAGLVEAAWARALGSDAPSKAETTDKEQSRLAASYALASVGKALSKELHNQLQADRKWRYGTIGGLSVLVLFLLSFLAWRIWYPARIVSKSTQHPSPQAAPAERLDVAAGAGLMWNPGAQGRVSRPDAAHAARALKSAAEVKRRNSAIQQPPTKRSPVSTDTSGSMTGDDDVPQIEISSASSTDLGSALSTAPARPSLGPPISQGVAGGVLQYKVQPVYPEKARRLRLEGDVVLDAMVTIEGRVENLKLISGNAILAQAAMDAVRQWRYTPCLLNGEPVPKETRITIRFAAPK
jgi:protein TonB